MSDFIADVFSALDDNPFEEIPVDVRTFVESKDFLGQPGLSDAQYEIVENMSQIYRVEELALFVENPEEYHRKYTKRELVLALGKGCHAPDTRVFDPVSGQLFPLSRHRHDMVQTMSGPEFAEAPFAEGVGRMYRVTTEHGYSENVYLGHKYYSRDGFKEVRDLAPGDEILMMFGTEPIITMSMEPDLAEFYGIVAANCNRPSSNGTVVLKFPDTYTKIPARVRELCKKYNNKLIESRTYGEHTMRVLKGPLMEKYGQGQPISPKVWRYDRESMRHFINGVFYESNKIIVQHRRGIDLRHLALRANRLGIMRPHPHGFSLTLGDEVPDEHWEKIDSIEFITEGKYWTRTVPGSGHYVSDGFVSANSGKDYMSTIGVAYIVYKLLCLNDPAEYYGKPSGDAIDIMNIAINAQQAKNVFFKGFKSKIERSPWFKGKFASRMDYIEFDKGVTVYSGHSERESHEGLNLFCAVLDEISGFVHESESGVQRTKSADAIYKAFRGTVDSRFASEGKVILLSFPRHKEDYISHKYDQAIAEKETIIRSHEFKIRDDMPDGLEGNHFTIEWEEDHIMAYSFPGVFALKRPTWEINPTRNIEDFKHAFYTDPQDALQRFACCDENTLIPTEKGTVPLKNVSVGDKVQSQHGPTTVTHKWEQEKESIEITLDNGQQLICTKDHGVLQVTSIRNGKGVAKRLGKYRQRWVEAGSLKVGDKIRTSYNSSIASGANISHEEAYALGLILTDGWLRNDDRKYVGVACGTSQNYAESVSSLLNSIDGVSSYVQSRMPNPQLSQRRQYSVHVTQYDAVERFNQLGLVRSKAQEKVLPDIVYNMNRSQFYAFMSGFIDGDGSFGRDGEIVLVSTSRRMLKELQVVMAHHGLRSHLWLNKRADSGIINSTHDLWGLRLNRLASMLLGENLNLLSAKSGKNVQTPFVQDGKGVFEREYGTIVKIDNVGVRRVIDITTENNEFIANGIVVHNCMPPDAISGYFTDHAKILESFSNKPIIVEGERFPSWFRPDPQFKYFMHVDLAQKHDRCAIAVAHVDSWVQVPYITGADYYAPYVTVDFLYWWTPTRNQSVDFKEVREFIVRSSRLGFNYTLVTFDRWSSFEMMNELRALGIPSENLSVARAHYDEFKLALMESRVSGPNIELLHDELRKLQLIKNKVDHPRSGHNDLSDATCGAIYNAITLTPYDDFSAVEVRSMSDMTRTEQQTTQAPSIEPPKRMPPDLAEYLDRMRAL